MNDKKLNEGHSHMRAAENWSVIVYFISNSFLYLII